MFGRNLASPLVLGTVALAAVLAWGQTRPTAPAVRSDDDEGPPRMPSGTVLATVNGMPIVAADVDFVMDGGGHGDALPSESRENVLAYIIRKELIRQRATELGLDADPGYREKLHRMEAQLNAFVRDELENLFWRDISRKAEVSDDEAEAYFDKNAERISTEYRVWQLLWRSEAAAKKALADLAAGVSFEEMAGKRFPKVPGAERDPWDLGYLHWKQIPESWGDAFYALEVGDVSGVIRGPNKRFWIIKLVDKRRNPDISFESIKPTIVDMLKAEKIERRRDAAVRELEQKARIVYPTRGPAPPGS